MDAKTLLEKYAAGERVFHLVGLSSANLYGANLEGANLDGANLRGANLCGAKGLKSTTAKGE